MKRRVLAAVLSLVMVFSLASMCFAAEETQIAAGLTSSPFTDTTADANSAYEYTIIGSDGSSETVRIAAVNTDTGNGVEPADDATVTYFTKLDNPASVDGSVPALLVYEYSGSTYAVSTSKKGTQVTVVDDRIDTADPNCQWTITKINNSYTIKNSGKYLYLDRGLINGWSVRWDDSETSLSGAINNDGIQFRRTVPWNSTRYLDVDANGLTVNKNSGATFYIYQQTTETVSGKYKVNHEGLDALLARTFTEAEYTTDSWAAYEAAKQAAQGAIAALEPYYDTEAEANEALQTIDAVHNDLQAAINALEKLEIVKPVIAWNRTKDVSGNYVANVPHVNSDDAYTDAASGIVYNQYEALTWKWTDIEKLVDDRDDRVNDVWTTHSDGARYCEFSTKDHSAKDWDYSNVYKIAGTFEWPADYDLSETTLTLQSKNDSMYQAIYQYIEDNGLSDQFPDGKVFPVDDDVYAVLWVDDDTAENGGKPTTSNINDYLLFWTGTSGKGIWTYNGNTNADWNRHTPATFVSANRQGVRAFRNAWPNGAGTENKSVVNNTMAYLAHSDGWYTLTDTSAINSVVRNNYPEGIAAGATVHLDLYCFNNSGSGAIDEIELVLTKKQKTEADVNINYYLGSVTAQNFLGSSVLTNQKIGSSITLQGGTNASQLDYMYRAAVAKAGSAQSVEAGKQTGSVPYIVQKNQNVINVVYLLKDDNSQYLVYDFGTTNVFKSVLSGAELGAKSVALEKSDNVNASFDFSNNTLTFKPSSAAETEIAVTLKLNYGDGAITDKLVYLIPASNVLYEEDFMSTDAQVYASWAQQGSNTVGEVTDNAETVYGYTTVYSTSANASGGSQYCASVTPAGSTRFTDILSFSFTGTGFDLIGQCGPDTGTLAVRVADSNNKTAKNYLIDTSFKDPAYNTIYQVPLLHCTDLKDGTYTVTISGAYIDYSASSNANTSVASTFSMGSVGTSVIDTIYELADWMGMDEDDIDSIEFINMDELYSASTFALTSSDNNVTATAEPAATGETMQFGIDGFRVYHITSNDQYADNENGVYYKNALDAVGVDKIIAYIEPNTNISDSGYAVADYEGLGGPQNEVYLASGQSVAFKVTGLKPVQVSVRSVAPGVGTPKLNSIEIKHATEMYYEITPDAETGIVTITNTGNGLLAICNFKFASDTSLNVLTEDDMPVVFAVLRMVVDAEPEPEPEPTPAPVFEPDKFELRTSSIRTRNRRIVTLTITASTDVDHVVVNGKTYYPMNKLLVKWGLSKTYVFTIMDTAGASETRSFEIVAYNADGLASSTYTDAG